MAGAPRSPQGCTGATMLAARCGKAARRVFVDAKFEAAGGVTALFGPSGAGKTIDHQHDRRTGDAAIAAASCRRRRRCSTTGARHHRAAAPAPHRLCVSGRPAVSALCRCAQIFDYGAPHSGDRAQTPSNAAVSSTSSTSGICLTAGPASFPAANASASRSAARC